MKNSKSQVTLMAAVALLLFVASSCSKSDSQSGTTFDLANAKKEIEAADQNFSEILSKGDSVGLADCYTADAKFLGANMPAIVGRKNIQSVLASFIKAKVTKLEIKSLEVWGTPEVLTEEGELIISTSDGKLIDKGKFIVVWKKEGDKWKIFRDMSSSDLPLPSAK